MKYTFKCSDKLIQDNPISQWKLRCTNFIFFTSNRFFFQFYFAPELKLKQWLEIKLIPFTFLQIHSFMLRLRLVISRPDSPTIHLTTIPSKPITCFSRIVQFNYYARRKDKQESYLKEVELCIVESAVIILVRNSKNASEGFNTGRFHLRNKGKFSIYLNTKRLH